MKTPIKLIEMFNCVVIDNDNTLADTVVSNLQTLAINRGYIISNNALNDSVLDFIFSKQSDYNSTFYKSWSYVQGTDRAILFIEQLLHYSTGWVPDGTCIVPDIEKYTIIKAVTVDEMVSRCMNMLYSGIAMQMSTWTPIVDFLGDVIKNCKEYCLVDHDFNLKIDIDKVANKEAKIALYKAFGMIPRTPIDQLRFIVWTALGDSMLIKSPEALQKFRLHLDLEEVNANVRQILETIRKNEKYMIGMASIFYRFKPYFLILKNKCPSYKTMINKIRRMAYTHHKPMKTGMWETIISSPQPWPYKDLYDQLGNISNFKIINLLQAVREKRLIYSGSYGPEHYRIRNGKVFIKNVPNPPALSPLYDWWDDIEDTLKHQLIENMRNKKCYVILPDKKISLACPVSEKNFIGNYPEGTTYKLSDHNFIGIYWRGEDGAQDLDLSFQNTRGHKIGWNAFYESEPVIFSGDMIQAKPEASEVLYFKNTTPDGIIYCNLYNGTPGSKYKFMMGRDDSIKKLPSNYMVNPNKIAFEVEAQAAGTQTLGVILDGEYLCTSTKLDNSRISEHSTDPNALVNIYKRKKMSRVDLKEVLRQAGFRFISSTKQVPEGAEVVNLKELDKDTLIKLFS